MIPNVTKGGDMRGLLTYLVGPGRANEHETPHVVASDGYPTFWYGTETLDAAGAADLAKYLEDPRKTYGTEIRAQVTTQDPETGKKVVTGYRDAHVWHCSLSVGVEDGTLSNEQWAAVAEDFMGRMGFTDADGKSPCRWVAIHHGASRNGNDHIHIAASMVREDGTKWDGRWRDYQAAQDAVRQIEVDHQLARVEGPTLAVVAERGEKPAERRQAAQAGLTSTAPKELGHRIRAAALASTSEAEWIRRTRADGVVLKPFFAKGTTEVVTGYRAALKPEQYSGKLVFYKGGSLGRDLSLPRLREGWASPSLDEAQAASAEWQAAFRGQRPVGSEKGRERVRFGQLNPAAQDVAAANWAAYNTRLAQVPVGDRAAWGDAARDAAGVLSAWARVDPNHREELRAAAAALSRSAQVRRGPEPAGQRGKDSPMGAALILMSAVHKDRSKIQAALLMRQVLKTAIALRDMHAAAGALRQAQLVQHQVVERLQRVQMIGYKATMPEGLDAKAQESWKAAEAARETASALTGGGAPPVGASAGAGRGSGQGPLPNRLGPARDPAQGSGREAERESLQARRRRAAAHGGAEREGSEHER